MEQASRCSLMSSVILRKNIAISRSNASSVHLKQSGNKTWHGMVKYIQVQFPHHFTNLLSTYLFPGISIHHWFGCVSCVEYSLFFGTLTTGDTYQRMYHFMINSHVHQPLLSICIVCNCFDDYVQNYGLQERRTINAVNVGRNSIRNRI